MRSQSAMMVMSRPLEVTSSTAMAPPQATAQKPVGSQPPQWGHQTACCGRPVRTKALVDQSRSGFVGNSVVAKNSHRGHGDVSCWGKLLGFDERQAAATLGFEGSTVAWGGGDGTGWTSVRRVVSYSCCEVRRARDGRWAVSRGVFHLCIFHPCGPNKRWFPWKMLLTTSAINLLDAMGLVMAHPDKWSSHGT